MPRFARRQRGSVPGAPGSDGSDRDPDRDADRGARAFEEALGAARSDLAAIADEIGVLDVDVQSPTAPPDAGDRYGEALRSFMLAGEQLERAQRSADLVAVGAALERARYELACIRALLDGVDSPARTAPCLFDPRHGPSVAEVQWSAVRGDAAGVRGDAAAGVRGDAAAGVRGDAAAGVRGDAAAGVRSDPAGVPACAADAQRLAEGAAPDVRTVSLGGRPTPYWDVPVVYGPLLVGYYDHFGGAERLTGLLRGTPLGDALAADR